MPRDRSNAGRPPALPAVFELLRAEGLEPPPEAAERLQAFEDLVQHWQRAVPLVSRGDLPQLRERHTLDALSLAPQVASHAMSGPWLDLGSGGGFPALPVKLVLPNADLTCVERNARKAAFLRHAIGRLGLGAARVVRGTFPEEIEVDRYAVVTARAVERPEGWLEPVLDQLAPGAVFLNQTGHKPTDAGKFHVERIEDMWRQRGWRRGQLQTIRKRA